MQVSHVDKDMLEQSYTIPQSISKEYLIHPLGLTLSTPGLVNIHNHLNRVFLVLVIMLEYTKLVVSILLIVIFFILFGLERIQLLKDKGVVISRFEVTPSQFPSPGHIQSYILKMFELNIFFLRNFYRSYTFFLFTSIMHCQYNNSNIIQRVPQQQWNYFH